MLTRFFTNSKSLNLILVICLALLACIKVAFNSESNPINIPWFLEQTGVFALILFSLFILNFISYKNSLTVKYSLETLFFSLLLLIIPQVLVIKSVLIANVFILLALRKILSLHSKKQTNQKLFDASILITIASFFYFWSILFFSIVFIAVFLYKLGHIKYWIIPFIGFMAVAVIAYCIQMVFNVNIFHFENSAVNFSFSTLNTTSIKVNLSFLLVLALWSLPYYIKDIKTKNREFRPVNKLVLGAFFIALIIILISENKNGSEFIFVFAPLSILFSNYLEIEKTSWLKETFFIIILLLPVFTLFF